MQVRVMWYATASLTPAILLGLGSVFGGIWTVLGLAALTGVAFVLDQLPGPSVTHETANLRVLNLTLGCVHLALIPFAVLGITNSDSVLNSVLLFVGYALFFGQVSNANAHELIHHPGRWHRRLGLWVYASLLHGHHVSAHLRVHHVWAATDRDPNSARMGENLYRFVWRAIPGEFRAGFHAERARPHPYLLCALIAGVTLGVIWWLAGTGGVLIWLGLVIYAQLQLYASDYVQHYGLRRQMGADGRPIPVSASHAWNAPHWYTSAMMMNAPRHSDHHLNPMRPAPELRLEDTMPMLPYPLPVMVCVAFCPPLWRRMMHPRLGRLPPEVVANPDPI